MLHKEWVFTRFAVQILHLCVYSRLFTPTLRVGFYPHKRTLLGTLRLRLCCRASSPVRCDDTCARRPWHGGWYWLHDAPEGRGSLFLESTLHDVQSPTNSH